MKNAGYFDHRQANFAAASPSDFLVRHGKRERAAQFGLSDEHEESFELNQSFPRLNQKPQLAHHLLTPDLNRIKGYELSSINFVKPTLTTTVSNCKKSYLLNDTVYSPMAETTNNTSTNNNNNKSWLFYNQFVNTRALLNVSSVSESATALNSNVQMISNPNKAVVVINGRTSEILTANDVACELFGYRGRGDNNDDENDVLAGRRLRELLVNDDDDADSSEILMESDRLDEHGRAVLCSGKIFDAIVGGGGDERIPVSVYIVKLTDDSQQPRCLCVMEPIQRVLGTFGINLKGRIRYYNSNFSYIFGYANNPIIETSHQNSPRPLSNLSAFSLLNGKDISDLIPNMKLPMSNIQPEIRRQALTGRTCQGENIPLTVTFLNKKLYNNDEIVYNCSVSVYMNISGLITVRTSDSKINSYNSTFARLLLGYDEKQLIGKPITSLITNFFEPDVNSTAARYGTSKPSTPLRVNASYLNVENNTNNKKVAMLAPNSVPRSLNGSTARQRAVNSGNGGTLPVVPKFVITEPSSADRGGSNSSSSSTAAAVGAPSQSSSSSLHPNVHCCFNCNAPLDNLGGGEAANQLAPLDDMCSPSKKCANYLDSNIFPSSSGYPIAPSHSSLPTTPQSTQAKKSLLARAIKNNMAQLSINLFGGSSSTTAALNRSIDDVSMLSNNCASSTAGAGDLSTDAIADIDIASPTAVAATAAGSDLNSSFQSDFSSTSMTPESSPQRKKVGFNEENNQLHEDNDDDDEDVEEDEDEAMDYSLTNHRNDDEERKMWNWCEKCKAEARKKDQQKGAADNSIMDDDGSDSSDVESIDEQHSTKSGGRKRKPEEEAERAAGVATAASSSSSAARRDEEDDDAKSDSSKKKFKNQVTSTPAAGTGNLDRKRRGNQLDEGMFFGKARHVDGKLIRVVYQRKYLNEEIICVWISRDPYSDKSIIDCSVDQSMFHKTNQTFNDANNAYSNEYEDLSTLGRGASGFVQLARRRIDQFEVVTKYILKSKIYKDSWINDSRYGTVPMEVSILCKIEHANIIKVLEVFNEPGEDHIQMVMEKHGVGMDLFEYIDRQRRPVNEQLASGIFRQIVSAVSYLHSHGIVHRDIKDENIVINEKFHIKLIDFGSAAYYTPGKKFSTFCGTMDYCSPDVLLGNKYFGPELDVWTCGIALYTLVYCENPFLDADETIECILRPPYKVSKELMLLMFSALCADPEKRATIKEIETNEWVTQPVDLSQFVWSEVLHNTEFVSNNAGEVNQPDDLKELNYKPTNVPSNSSKENQESEVTTKKPLFQEKFDDHPTEKLHFDENYTSLKDKISLLSKSF